MIEYGLEIHPDKTKIVYCMQEKRRKQQPDYVEYKFDFLGYGFQTRTNLDKVRNKFNDGFASVISDKAKKKIKDEIRKLKIYHYTIYSDQELSNILKSKIIGWINYYGKFRKSELYGVFKVLNNAIVKWIKKKYKIVSVREAYKKFNELKKAKIFAHFVLLS
jgi:hypothetical protein